MTFWTLNADHSLRRVTLEEHIASITENFEQFEQRFRVGKTVIDGDCWVSTTFLWAFPSFDDRRPPRLFETMVFGGDLDKLQRRYATWDEALAGHAEVVAQVMGQRV